ncbi:MAG: hypothetical protein A3A58_03690 [Candidatus Blackburnbacteria bacterium RIFCSPLOWO2_01_FULL_41_27]|uniref:Non-canonical purine NTP pyrophosphatase n=2 Tax=Candidatus Blackburniibacteriota TaxID=1817898 RepID=A0A1G1V5S9_9BACT|nr:MAG: hypothetical protein A3F61_01195 [Candidatus Blackburnbacteria bacterium RIFCSPHIGHO2_12_FULL_41_13b]OGY13930.1 MAG: hypothetical protein A3A58_03690 [Candidatus Blackburnbacteria bacterium RIFCSPLOWO2_01_FULL_41_27]
MKIDFITSNAAKVNLANERLAKYGVEVLQKPLPLYEIQSLDIIEVAKSKAEQALKFTSEPFIIEDSSMCIKSLNNFPGTLLKPVFDSLGDELILRLLKKGQDRSVTVISQLIYYPGKNKELKLFQGTYNGVLPNEPRGDNMRGWKVSRIFIPKNKDKTLAEMNDQEWQEFLDDFRQDDHFEKLGNWISEK